MTVNNNSARHKAEIAGERRYVADKPCYRGHVAIRSKTTGACIECRKENKIKSDEKNMNRSYDDERVNDRSPNRIPGIIPGARVFIDGREVPNERR